MRESSSSPSFNDILKFVTVVLLVVAAYPWLSRWLNPPRPQAAQPPAVAGDKQQKDDKAAGPKNADGKKSAKVEPKPSDEPVDQTALANAAKPSKPKAEAEVKPAPVDRDSRRWITLGSVDPDLKENPYRMLATFSRQGGSLVRLELSNERYRDLDDRCGYLGHLVMERVDPKSDEAAQGCLVQVVGAGTPAAKAGVKPGDRIMSITYRGKTKEIQSFDDLETVLRTTEPKEKVTLSLRRADDKNKQEERVDVALIRRPVEVIRPERRTPSVDWVRNGSTDAVNPKADCPSPFLTTLQQVDDSKLRADEDPDAKFEEEIAKELPGVALRDAIWTIESPAKADAASATTVVFSAAVPEHHLKITKTYELVKVEGQGNGEDDWSAYHLKLSVEITNNDSVKHVVAFRQDGPNGLPVEGAWYVTSKVGRTWSAEGLRDVVYQLADGDVGVVTCSHLSEKADNTVKFREVIGESAQFADHRPLFFGVDAQYFSVAMIPDAKSTAPNIERAVALRVGDVAELRRTLTNTSFRLISKTFTIEPGKTSEPQRYEVFAGPKRPELLAKYQMSGVINYGWPIFRMVAVPMTQVLHFFYWLIPNFGLAIIMLTVMVRLAMHPMSRTQAQNALMMQKLQPEMKAIQQKFKKDPEAARKAQQELFSKHNYNPLGGCLLLLIQMPIFLGLYRSLQVDFELRGAPLIPLEAVRWCSNLAAPDMLFDWSWFMPQAVSNGIGFLWLPLLGPLCGLGPYLNLFPIVTLVLFIVQQKVMMPPAADEQAAMQQKMMKYMMILMGLMFFKVAAGLCIYFIASTLWGLAERRFLPKAAKGGAAGEVVLDAPKPPAKPRLTDSERDVIRRQKRKK